MLFPICTSRYAAAILVAALVVNAGAQQQQSQLLVLAKDHSLATTSSLVKPYGKVVAKDRASGLFRVALRPGVSTKDIKLRLRHDARVSAVLEGDQARVDRFSIHSVDDHTSYLQWVAKHQARDLEGDLDRERAGTDWWEAYRHYLKDRVNLNGIYDPQPFIDAIQHRGKMPVAQLTDPHNRLPSGVWAYVGPKNMDIPYRQYYGAKPLSGRVNAIAVNPNNHNIIYIGAADGGAWKTTDGGTTWTPLGDKWSYMQVSSIALDPTNPSIIYVGTGDFAGGQAGYANGIMKSADGGSTWNNYGGSVFGPIAISKIIVDPKDPQIVVATAGRLSQLPGGIFRSTDGGVTWAATNAPTYWWCDMSISAPDGNGNRTYWAVGEANGGAPLYRSTDQGATWSAVATNPFAPVTHYATAVACSKVSPGTVYLLEPDTASAGNGMPPSNNHIWKSIDNGSTWSDIRGGFPNGFSSGTSSDIVYNWSQDSYDWHINTSTTTVGGVTKDAIYVGLITIAMSPDAGLHWIDIGKTFSASALTHNDQHSFAVDPVDPNTVFIGSDGGIFRAVYNPSAQAATFTGLNAALYISQAYKIALHPTDPTRIMAGTQDNAGPASAGDLNNWINPGAGDGAAQAYDPFNPSIAYSGTQSLGINRTDNGWASNQGDISGGQTFNGEAINFIPPFVLANKGAAPSTLFAGTDHLWKWTLAGGWVGDLGAQFLTGGGGASVKVLATAPSDANRIFSGSEDGYLLLTSNLGTSWVEVDPLGTTTRGFGAPISGICASPTNANDVLVSLTQTGPYAHLQRCANVLAATPSWSSVSGSGSTGLPPNIPVNAVARDPYAPDTTWYAATDIGMFMTTNGGTTWANMTAPLGLPNVQVYDLQVNGATGYLYAGTFGRGIWRIRLVNPATVAVSAATLGSSTVTAGSSTTLTVSLNSPAPYGNVVVGLSSSSSSATVPPSVTVANGSSSAQVTVTTGTVSSSTSVTLTATYHGSKTATLTINPNVTPPILSSLSIPSVWTGGNPFTATATVDRAAPVGGTTISISTDTNLIFSRTSVTVPAGATQVSWTCYSYDALANVVKHMYAAYNGVTKTASMTIVPGGLFKVTVPSSITSGQPATGTLTLSGPCVPVGILVSLRTDNTHVQVPSSVRVPGRASSTTFPITTTAFTGSPISVKVFASSGNEYLNATLTLNPGP